MKNLTDEINVRITVVNPPKDVLFCLQSGQTDRATLVPPVATDGDDQIFDFTLRLVASEDWAPPVFRGALAQGPPSARFVYLNTGTYAGHRDSQWSRRAKVPLSGISREMIEELLAGGGGKILKASIQGTGRDGGPSCATVPLIGNRWVVVSR